MVAPPAPCAYQSNLIKNFANWNLCYSCGFDIEDGHTSITCPTLWRRPNHPEGFLKANAHEYINQRWDPCTKAMHKRKFLGFRQSGAENIIAHKCNHLVSAFSSDPTQIINVRMNVVDDDKTIVTSNCSADSTPTSLAKKIVRKNLAAVARHLFGTPLPQYLNAITIATLQVIADMGATSIFVVEGTPVQNLRPAIHPLTINLPDGTKVKSTHTCNITIPGLPTVLVGHVVPKISIASLIGIRVLCNAGCKVIFTKTSCDIIYDGKIILRGNKDPSTDLWMLPINTTNERVKTTQNDAKGTQDHHA
jgi:hypothetical protein